MVVIKGRPLCDQYVANQHCAMITSGKVHIQGYWFNFGLRLHVWAGHSYTLVN